MTTSAPKLQGLASDEAAAAWLVRIDAAPLSVDEQTEFDGWCAESPANAAAFSRAQATWALFNETDNDPTLNVLRASALAVKKRPRYGLWMGAGLAAAASLVAAIALNMHRLPGQFENSGTRLATKSSTAGSTSGPSEYATAKGERRTIKLADGTAVTLNTDSAVRVAYIADHRFVRLLRGQALFEVAKDPHRPFIVQAGERQITALGTVFEVRLDTNRMKVMLVEGKVVVDQAEDSAATGGKIMVPTVLTPGETLVAKGQAAPQISTVDVEQQLRWRDGFVEFNDTPLAEAVSEMNRYSTKQLIARSPQVANLRVSGVFRTGSPDRFAAIAGELLPVRKQALPDGTVELVPATQQP